MNDIDRDAIEMAVMEALGSALDEQLGAPMGDQLDAGAPAVPSDGAPLDELELPAAADPGMGSLDAAHEQIHAEDDEEPRQSRAGWRPWMRRPPDGRGY